MYRFTLCCVLTLLATALALPARPTLARPPAAPSDSAFGINSHIGSRYPNFDTMNVPVDLVVQSGAGWAREDFQINRIMPEENRFDWGFADEAVKQLSAKGLTIIGILNGPTPAWAAPGTGGGGYFPPDPQSYARFVGEVVKRYPGIRYWQVWNEPDNPTYWQPSPSAAAYAQLLKTAYPAIKSANPDAVVLAAGLVSPEPAITFLNEIANNGAWGAFDVVAVHPYADPKGPEDGQVDAFGVQAVRTLVNRLGAKPIWATEIGWSTGANRHGGAPVDEETQANYLVRSMTMVRGAGAERVVWYNLKDDSLDYGMFRKGSGGADYSQPKTAYGAFKTLNEQLAGTTPVGALQLGERQLAFDFENFGSWQRGDQPNGEFTQSSAQAHSGSFSGQLSYRFGSGDNDFVVFFSQQPISIGAPSRLGLWVYGDNSGHELKVWLRDAGGELLQFRLGAVGGAGWQFASTSLSGQVEEGNVIDNGQNRRLDLPAELFAIVLDDAPNSATGQGTIYIDDVTSINGPELYGVRFAKGDEVVDVLWAPAGGQASIPTASSQGTLVNRGGTTSRPSASNGQFSLSLGPSPVFLTHRPGAAVDAAPQPERKVPEPQPTQPTTGPEVAPSADRVCFSETGFCIQGRIREFWEQNGGLPVFGYPITPQREEQIEGTPFQVQWFERNRLELHPENQRPYDVLLGRLGAVRLEKQGRDWQKFPKSQAQSGCRYFSETGQNVCGDILAAWRANGLEFDGQRGTSESESLALFGLPISPLQTETLEGKQFQVQWFERARFELHPENTQPYNVLLGLLGRETLTGE